MQPIPPHISTCPTCGGALEKTHGGGVGCPVCLLRAGIGVEDSPTEAQEDSTTPRHFGVYEIERREDGSLCELGHGGMGATYRAIDTTLQRKVALKIIRTGIATRSTEARERFLREARAAAALRHEHIATVFQFGISEETGQFFYAMELIEGETLEERVRRTGPLSVSTTIDIAQQVTSALAAAEKRSLIHRDLKPGNLMLVAPDDEEQGTAERGVDIVKIIDFGLAKVLNAPFDPMHLTHDGFVGTPAFASPEQFEKSALDVRSDIYSLGVTLWLALTGKTPFGGYSFEEIRRAQQSDVLPIEQLKAARVPSRLKTLLKSMLAFEPAARPGTRELAAELRRCAVEAHRQRRARVAVAAAAILILGISAFAILWPLSKGHPPARGLGVTDRTAALTKKPPLNLVVLEKSIAVLPFENRSEEKQNAYFADGVQGEILTDLAKVADLKVISRTSVMQYRSGAERNVREIGQQLSVAHLVEGSVQRSGNRVRVNVQLVDARTDRQLWAQTYDRDLADVFAIQSEIAKAIADRLQAKLTGREEQALAIRPTNNPEAYDAYLRGLAYTLKTDNTAANALGAQKYLREAVRLDPTFAMAWALLSYIDGRGYLTESLQPTIALREEARQAAETALALQPNLGEAVWAKGYYHYSCLKDYNTAAQYFEQARQFLPNSSKIPESLAYVARRRGQWDRSEAYFDEAERLDPRNVYLITQRAISYISLRHFHEALQKLDQVLNITPGDLDTLATKAAIAQAEGDLPRASALLGPLRPSAADTQALEAQVYQAILERRPAQMIPRLKEILAKPDPALGYINGRLRFWLGWAQEVGGDRAAAHATWRQTRSELAPLFNEQPENYSLIEILTLTNAGLGDKATALALLERAMATLRIEKDAIIGAVPIAILARVAAQMGEPDRAIAALQKLLSIPCAGPLPENVPLTPALLRLDPMFDPLRNDPRFKKLCEKKQP
jgi:serine/threonine protein kinase/Tfp pilus assembly protein PilF